MSTVDFEPLTIDVPLSEEPPGVFRLGNSRVLLELVLRAFIQGESAEAIVRSFRTLRLADVYTLISRYLANPTPFEGYLQRCEAEASTARSKLEAAGMASPVSNDELLARDRAKGLLS
jgi:hypothetical protein